MIKIRPNSVIIQPLLDRLLDKATEYNKLLKSKNINIPIYVWIKESCGLYPKIEFSDKNSNEELQFDMCYEDNKLFVREAHFKRFVVTDGNYSRKDISYAEANDTLKDIFDSIENLQEIFL